MLCFVVQKDTIEVVTSSHLNRLMPHVPQKFLRVGLTQKPGFSCVQLLFVCLSLLAFHYLLCIPESAVLNFCNLLVITELTYARVIKVVFLS